LYGRIPALESVKIIVTLRFNFLWTKHSTYIATKVAIWKTTTNRLCFWGQSVRRTIKYVYIPNKSACWKRNI